MCAYTQINQTDLQFDLSSLTPRRSILDPKKLEYLSKHHTQRLIEADSDSDPGELVLKAKALLEEEYPFSTSYVFLKSQGQDELILMLFIH